MSDIERKVNRILRELKLNKQGAFERLVAATYNHLGLVALNYLWDKNDVEDVLNDAYLKVHLYLDSVDLQKNGYHWLCKIVRNLSYDYNKRRGQTTESLSRIDEGKLFYELDGFWEYCELSSAISSLDPLQQNLLYYLFWEGYSPAELCEKLRIKRAHIDREIKKIYRILKDKIKL